MTAELDETFRKKTKSLEEQEELPLCSGASNLYNRLRIRELNRQDARISPDIRF